MKPTKLAGCVLENLNFNQKTFSLLTTCFVLQYLSSPLLVSRGSNEIKKMNVLQKCQDINLRFSNLDMDTPA